jgi:hypothetical protein
LRKVYRDPMTGASAWGLVEAPGGGIRGVYSLSRDKPAKIANFDTADSDFERAASYVDWKFVFAGDRAEAPKHLDVNLPPQPSGPEITRQPVRKQP